MRIIMSCALPVYSGVVTDIVNCIQLLKRGSTMNKTLSDSFNGLQADNRLWPTSRHWRCTLILSIVFGAMIMNNVAAPARAQCAIQWNNTLTSEAGTRPYALGAGDFDGDGKQDLAVASYTFNNVSILIGIGNGTFVPPAANQIYSFGTNPGDLVVGDFNTDNNLDFAVVCRNAEGVFIFLGNGNGTFQQPPLVFHTSFGSNSIAEGDFNRDGRTDLAVVSDNGTNSVVSILMGHNDNPSTLFDGTQQTSIVSRAFALAVGDFNHDQKPDLAVLRNENGSRVSILSGNGLGFFVQSFEYFVATNFSYAIGAGDFNSDGNSDLAVANKDNGTVTVLLSDGASGSLKASAAYFTGGVNPGWDSSGLVVDDIDEDGNLDIIVANYLSNSIKIFRGTGGGTFLNGGLLAVGTAPASIIVAKLDGDQKKDIATANTNNPDLTKVSVKINASTAGPEITQQPFDQIAYNGYAAHLSISATDAISYQWRRDGINLLNGSGVSGATTAHLTINPISGGDFGVPFDCIATNTCGTVTSNSAMITILHDCAGDMNHDGNFDGLDITNFVDELLNGTGCPK